MVDKTYCMSSFLMYRKVMKDGYCFKEGREPKKFALDFPRIPVYGSKDLEQVIAQKMKEWTKDGKAALALSGGIDSAILAKYMPKGSKTYTFQCKVPAMEVTNEVPQAKRYAQECGLENEVVEIYWEDMEMYAPLLMKHKNAPIHSIEVQIYKAACKAKEDGFERLIFGESSDVNYGGLSGLMSKDWLFGEFVDRYSYVLPYKVLKESELVLEPYQSCEKAGYVNAHEFCRTTFLEEGMGSYVNACECAGIQIETPYVYTYLASELDYERIRRGENKYVVRELFHKLYQGFEVPEKLPMPRAVNEWLRDWNGPIRPEFYPHCIENMTGDQKWLVWALEKFLNLLDEG